MMKRQDLMLQKFRAPQLQYGFRRLPGSEPDHRGSDSGLMRGEGFFRDERGGEKRTMCLVLLVEVGTMYVEGYADVDIMYDDMILISASSDGVQGRTTSSLTRPNKGWVFRFWSRSGRAE